MIDALTAVAQRDTLAACHAAYWRPDAAALEALEAQAHRGTLGASALRWHHLRCLAAAATGDEAAAQRARASASVLRLADAHRGRLGRVWTLGAVEVSAQGVLDTRAHTHPGVLEYLPVNGQGEPTGVRFVSWSALAAVEFGPPAAFRTAVLTFEDPDRTPALVRVPTRHVLAGWAHAGARFGGPYDLEVAQRGVPTRVLLEAAFRVTLDPDPTHADFFEAQCARRGVSPGWARTVYDDWGRPPRPPGPCAKTLSGAFPSFVRAEPSR